MFAGRGGAGLLGDEASGAEGGGVGSGNGAGLTPTGPGAVEERSGMNVLPSAGGLGGGGGAEGATEAGGDDALGAADGLSIRFEGGGGVGVVVGGVTGGIGVAVSVGGAIGDGGGAGVAVSLGISGCFIEGGDRGGGIGSFALRSGVFRGFMGCPGIAKIFGPDEFVPDEEGALADLLGSIGVGDGPPLEGVGAEGEGGGKGDEFKDMMPTLPPVWVIDAADGLGAGGVGSLPGGVFVAVASTFGFFGTGAGAGFAFAESDLAGEESAV